MVHRRRSVMTHEREDRPWSFWMHPLYGCEERVMMTMSSEDEDETSLREGRVADGRLRTCHIGRGSHQDLQGTDGQVLGLAATALQ